MYLCMWRGNFEQEPIGKSDVVGSFVFNPK